MTAERETRRQAARAALIRAAEAMAEAKARRKQAKRGAHGSTAREEIEVRQASAACVMLRRHEKRSRNMSNESSPSAPPASDPVQLGQALALQLMLAQLAWEWAMTQPHPPSALSRWMRPVEEALAEMSAGKATNRRAIAAAQATATSVFSLVEHHLHGEALRRSQPQGPKN